MSDVNQTTLPTLEEIRQHTFDTSKYTVINGISKSTMQPPEELPPLQFSDIWTPTEVLDQRRENEIKKKYRSHKDYVRHELLWGA